jgi:hypothetical protein
MGTRTYSRRGVLTALGRAREAQRAGGLAATPGILNTEFQPGVLNNDDVYGEATERIVYPMEDYENFVTKELNSSYTPPSVKAEILENYSIPQLAAEAVRAVVTGVSSIPYELFTESLFPIYSSARDIAFYAPTDATPLNVTRDAVNYLKETLRFHEDKATDNYEEERVQADSRIIAAALKNLMDAPGGLTPEKIARFLNTNLSFGEITDTFDSGGSGPPGYNEYDATVSYDVFEAMNDIRGDLTRIFHQK